MNKTSHNKPIEFYLEKKYPFVVHASEDGGYVAEIEELPGCVTQADTLTEVEDHIEEARRAWIEVAYEAGLEIPDPRTETLYSGRFIVRVPKTLHRELAEAASREGISLNQYVLFLLTGGTTLNSVHTSISELIGQHRGVMTRSFVLGSSLQPAVEWSMEARTPEYPKIAASGTGWRTVEELMSKKERVAA